MKIKKEYIILAIVIVALSVYLALRSSDRTQYKLPDIARVAAKEISKLQITRDKVTIVINRKDAKWYITPGDYPADGGKVKDMLNAIENLTLTALVSESKNHSLYDLNAKKKINVKAWQAESLKRDVDLGKTAASFRHTFVKISGDERVFHARGSFRGKFDKTVEDLRDKTVLSFKINEIREIHISKGKHKMAFNLTQPPKEVKPAENPDKSSPKSEPIKMLWQTAAGKNASSTKINRFLTTLSDLKCEEYISGQDKDEWKEPIFTLLLKGSKEYKLSIFEKLKIDKKDYPAISSENSYPFVLSGSEAENIMEDPKELLEKKKE